MTGAVYVFGSLGCGYTQYPDDYAKEIYQNFYDKTTANSQIIIHRDNNLIYYGYIRKLDTDSQYIGFCILLNGIMFSQIGKLFAIFEHAVADLVNRGKILRFNDKGDIVSDLDNLSEKQPEVERITSVICNDFSELENRILPPVNFGIANNETKNFSIIDKNNDIVEASAKYGYTCVFKDEDCDTASSSSYRGIIKKLYNQNETLSDNYKELKRKYDKLNEQKQQYLKVIILCIVIAICGIGLFFLQNSLDSTRNNLASAQKDITKKSETIKTLNITVAGLQTSLSEEQSKREKAENDFLELKSSFESYMPVIITDVEIANIYSNGSIETDYGETIYSSSSMYIKPKITYIGIKTDENITLNIKLYTPTGMSRGSYSPSDCSYTESFNVYSGSNTKSFNGWGGNSKGHWPSGTYRYEFWYGNVCLKAKTFTIY